MIFEDGDPFVEGILELVVIRFVLHDVAHTNDFWLSSKPFIMRLHVRLHKWHPANYSLMNSLLEAYSFREFSFT